MNKEIYVNNAKFIFSRLLLVFKSNLKYILLKIFIIIKLEIIEPINFEKKI